MADMELDQVEAFVAIAKQGGFTRASTILHLSQPAISRRVQLLEDAVGAPLFDRLRTRVMLTEAGRAFLPHAEAVLASVRDGIEAVAAVQGQAHGVVTLAIVGTLASTTLMQRLRRFRRAFPTIDLRVRTALSAEVSALVLCGDAAVGLRYGIDPQPYLVCATIQREAMVPVCSAAHPLVRTRRVPPRALAGERWLAFPSRPGAAREPYMSVLERQLAACGIEAPNIVPVDSLTAQKRMVEAGFGLALVPASSIDEERRAGTLRILNVVEIQASIPIVLIHRRRAFLSGATRALIAVLSQWSKVSAPAGTFRAGS